MKLFGWGKSKDPQPQTVLRQVKKTDPRNSSHGLDRGMFMGHTMPCKSTGSCAIQKQQQQGLFGDLDDDGYLHDVKDAGCDEIKSQADTIRFVFSHEQEGLLAIGTFALEQLAAIRDTIDVNHGRDGFESSTDMMMQSSDNEDLVPRSLKSVELSEAERGSTNEEKIMKPADQSNALTLYKNHSPVAGTKPIVLLTALPLELRKAGLDHPASPWTLHSNSQFPTYVPDLGHWTDSVLPPGLPEATVDEEFYSPSFCGLFGSKKKTSRTRSDKSKRIGQKDSIVHIEHEDSKNFTTKPIDQKTKKSMVNFGTNGVPSLGKLGKLWRSSCKQSSARIAPERKPCSPPASHFDFKGAASTANGIKSGEVLTTPVTQPLSPCDNRMRPPGRLPSDECSPKVAEFRKRVANHERNMVKLRDGVGSNRVDGGHWIKTDSEYVVLEM